MNETGRSAGTGEATVEEALLRARRHARASAAEAVAALRALMDAGVLAAGRSPSEGTLAPLAETLDNLRAWLDPEGGRDGADLMAGVTEALDEEVARWEARSRQDPEARSVLRAFLAVREVLFEVAARRTAPKESAAEAAEPPEPTPMPTRVQRISVEG
jgi:hypothetical protein